MPFLAGTHDADQLSKWKAESGSATLPFLGSYPPPRQSLPLAVSSSIRLRLLIRQQKNDIVLHLETQGEKKLAKPSLQKETTEETMKSLKP